MVLRPCKQVNLRRQKTMRASKSIVMVFVFIPANAVGCRSFNIASGSCLSTQWKLSDCHLESALMPDCLTDSCFANANKLRHIMRLISYPLDTAYTFIWMCMLNLFFFTESSRIHLSVTTRKIHSSSRCWTALLLCHHPKTLLYCWHVCSRLAPPSNNAVTVLDFLAVCCAIHLNECFYCRWSG